MRILHTADWHLGDRLGRINRTAHLKRGVERIAEYCEGERVDVLLVAGDLFSERCGADGLRDATEHLHRTFDPFLRRGGTILALTGNHDNETFCRTLRHAFDLAAPAPAADGGLAAPGRFHLAVGPTFFRIADRDGAEVQFVLMPYPTPGRYLDGERRFASLEDKNRALQSAYGTRLAAIRFHPAFRTDLPTVLAAHIHVQGAELSNSAAFRLGDDESVVVSDPSATAGWAYVALGHIHRPQAVMGQPFVRYSGGLDRLDLGERDDPRGCLVVDVGRDGPGGEPSWLPLEATPIYRVRISNPREDLPRLREEYPDAATALVRYELTYTPGVDDLDAVLDEINALFPHWYDRECRSALENVEPLPGRPAAEARRGLHETVLDYLESKLVDQPGREDVLTMAKAFLAEESP